MLCNIIPKEKRANELCSDRDPTTNESKDIIKVQFEETKSCIGVTKRSMDEVLLTKSQMIQRVLYSQNHPSMVTVHGSWTLEQALQPAGSSVHWRMPIPGTSINMNFF